MSDMRRDRTESHASEQAADALYSRFSTVMHRRAARYVHSPQDVEDVVSACWASLVRHLPTILGLPEKARSAYIMRSVQHSAIDFLRRQRQEVSLSMMTDLPDQADMERRIEQQDMIGSLLRQLPAKERQVTELKLAGYREKEIADRLDWPVASVRSCWRRARSRLRDAEWG